VGYVPVTPEQAGAGMRQAGMPDWLVEGVLEVHAMMRAGTGERTTDDVLTLTGHAPRDFASFARERAAAFA
jgi:NAD(P)H dehydrogenase (quinone)